MPNGVGSMAMGDALNRRADGPARNARVVERTIEQIAPIDRTARAVRFQSSSRIG
jgi:hypothetical protein